MTWFGPSEETQELQAIRRLLFYRLTLPGEMKTRLIGERRILNMDILSYEVTLPVVPAGSDVVAQRLDVTIDGVTASQSPELGVLVVPVEAPQDSAVALSLVYLDDAGNQSQASVRDFVATDTIVPAAPGEMTVTLVGERREE